MAIIWLGAVVFLVLLFVLFVPLFNRGSNDLGYPNPNLTVSYQQPQQQMNPSYAPPQYAPTSDRSGCVGFLTLLGIAALFFIGAVIFWSMSVQAVGGF